MNSETTYRFVPITKEVANKLDENTSYSIKQIGASEHYAFREIGKEIMYNSFPLLYEGMEILLPVEQTLQGYLFNGRFYKTMEELRGETMDENNQPEPLFFKRNN